MNVQRLHTLAKFLRKLPPKKRAAFALDTWVSLPQEAQYKLGPSVNVDEKIILASCGTSACAVGWCGSIPEFQKAGFQLLADDGYIRPVFEGRDDWRAVEAFFDLDGPTSEHLFMPSNYEEVEDPDTGEWTCQATPDDVADRIDQLTGLSSKGAAARAPLLLP